MFPVDKNAISAEFFAPSQTTEREVPPQSFEDTCEIGVQTSEVMENTSNSEATVDTCEAPVKFTDLIVLPKRDRKILKPRAKPPSFLLTSQEHFDYVKNRPTKKGKGNQKVTFKVNPPPRKREQQ